MDGNLLQTGWFSVWKYGLGLGIPMADAVIAVKVAGNRPYLKADTREWVAASLGMVYLLYGFRGQAYSARPEEGRLLFRFERKR